MLAQVQQLTSSARQVTVTVGGNDLRFVEVMKACALAGPACFAALPTPQDQQALGANLVALLTATRAQAPNARIYVTGYPALFQPTGAVCTTLDRGQVPYDPAQLHLADRLALGLNFVIGSAVGATQDPGITFVDVTPQFAGKGLCNPEGGITPPVVVGPGEFAPASLHPNQLGQRLYAEAIVAAGFTTSAIS